MQVPIQKEMNIVNMATQVAKDQKSGAVQRRLKRNSPRQQALEDGKLKDIPDDRVSFEGI